MLEVISRKCKICLHKYTDLPYYRLCHFTQCTRLSPVFMSLSDKASHSTSGQCDWPVKIYSCTQHNYYIIYANNIIIKIKLYNNNFF